MKKLSMEEKAAKLIEKQRKEKQKQLKEDKRKKKEEKAAQKQILQEKKEKSKVVIKQLIKKGYTNAKYAPKEFTNECKEVVRGAAQKVPTVRMIASISVGKSGILRVLAIKDDQAFVVLDYCYYLYVMSSDDVYFLGSVFDDIVKNKDDIPFLSKNRSAK